MPNYEVEFTYSSGRRGKQIVNASNTFDAKKYVEGLPGIGTVYIPKMIQEKTTNYNSNKRTNSSSDDSSSGVGVLIILIVGIVTFANTLPWSSMILGGMAGTWISQFITGTRLEDALDENKNKTVAFILIAALSLGGFGFVRGNEFKQEYDSPVKPELNINK